MKIVGRLDKQRLRPALHELELAFRGQRYTGKVTVFHLFATDSRAVELYGLGETRSWYPT